MAAGTAAVLLPVALALGGPHLSSAPIAAHESDSGSARTRTADRARTAAVPAVPDPVQPAFTPGAPRLLGAQRHVSLWSPVRTATSAHFRPRAHSSVVAHLSTRTPEGTTNLVTVLDRQEGRGGQVWVRARLPVLPNGTTGWIAREALGGYVAVRTHLIIDLGRLTARLERNGRTVFQAPIGAGKTSAPTPKGDFYIRNKLTSYKSPMYGPVAFGTSARSATLTDWPAGGFIGIHGTDQPQLLPGRVSHGCIRLSNPQILRLAKIMPVGTPVTIR
jgi:hypothetical protein